MKTILAAIDFSPVTDRVVSEAATLARAGDSRLILLNVTTPASLLRDYAALEALIAGAAPGTGLVGQPAGLAALHGESLQMVGEPVEVILQEAARCSADYIVMGSHGHTALFEWVVGGTASGVLRGAPCPVVLIPAVARSGRRRARRSLRRKDPATRLQRLARRKGAERTDSRRPRDRAFPGA